MQKRLVSIRKDATQLYWYIVGMIKNPPLEWEDRTTGDVEIEHITRRRRWYLLRPQWIRRLFTYKLSCGCGRRYWGRMAWYSANCTKHGSLGAYRRDRREFLDYADWSDIREVTDRLVRSPGDSDDLIAARAFLATQDQQMIARVAAALIGWLADTEAEDRDG